ncbi:DUF1120 domain-containing protein [Pseudomonas typographi]|uniref:DUF1120 domain-containing protein n=1 Tax=Pseudomonas typographi TaxID=2715964 RepID=A0ABR7YWL1_9PSED|nr:DUF1120 domain-containing protein [Pseudomonas typographi]MBD1585504.1 DUF1120 domain-containing protein [Pseudomonas typographi]MBD1597581.1 DUF1120 domain-containing protein [Pseudomonas typographi]
MNVMRKCFAIALCAIAACAHAGEEATLSVTGTVVPDTCTVSFSTSTINLGEIHSATLEPAQATDLSAQGLSYDITCPSALKVATQWADNRQGTAYGASAEYFGLGDVGGKPIGDYVLSYDADRALADGAPVALIVSRDGVNWADAHDVGYVIEPGNGQLFSHAQPGLPAPAAFSRYAGYVTLMPRIAPKNTLDLSSDINIDGSATLSLNYL